MAASCLDNGVGAGSVIGAEHRIRPDDAITLTLPLEKVHLFEPGDHGVSLAR